MRAGSEKPDPSELGRSMGGGINNTSFISLHYVPTLYVGAAACGLLLRDNHLKDGLLRRAACEERCTRAKITVSEQVAHCPCLIAARPRHMRNTAIGRTVPPTSASELPTACGLSKI